MVTSVTSDIYTSVMALMLYSFISLFSLMFHCTQVASAGEIAKDPNTAFKSFPPGTAKTKSKAGEKQASTTGIKTSPTGVVTLNFPLVGVGKLYSLPVNWGVAKKRNEEKYICAAKGVVSVPAGVPISLKLAYALTETPQLLVVPNGNIVQIYGDMIGFEDSICLPISKISSVTRVDLASSEITDAGVNQLCTASGVRALVISKTMLTGSCLPAIGKLNLLYLDISQNNLKGEYFKNFALLKHVTSVRFNNIGLTDDSLKYVAQMSSLKDLQLRGNNKLTDDGIKALQPLQSLQFLSLKDSKIGITGALWLLKNLKLKSLTLDDRVLLTPAGERLKSNYKNILNASVEKDMVEINTLYAPLK